jgi:phage shock protein C
MKNTITSSIGRIQFHLEEDAHQKLKNYLDDISRSIQGSEGHDEIMADIEARIAELLLQRIKDPQQVVTLTEVNEIIEIMGSPDSFSTGEKSSGKQEYASTGNYSYNNNNGYKRVFRDPDDKVLFGVCSGVAHHFGIDPLWLRLAFFFSIFIGGFGLILYIALAIIIPKARTAAEKLEMRGEPADISNIKRTVEEELNDLKKKVENVRDDFKSGRYRNTGRDAGQRIGDFFSSVGHGVGGALGGIIRAVISIVGFVLICLFSLILIALLVSLFSGVNVVHINGTHHHWHYSGHHLLNMFAASGTPRLLFLWGVALFVGIPLLALILRIGGAVVGIRNRMHGIRIALFIAWMVGLVFILVGGFQTFGHFSTSGYAKEEIKFTNPAKTLYVNMPVAKDEEFSLNIDSLNLYISDNNVFQGNPSVCIQASPDSDFHLEIEKSARGVSEPEAVQSAKQIEYSFSQHDSVLNLSQFYQLAEGGVWRKQKLELELLVPTSRAISLPKGIDEIMCAKVHGEHKHTGGHKWLMTSSGLVAKDSI